MFSNSENFTKHIHFRGNQMKAMRAHVTMLTIGALLSLKAPAGADEMPRKLSLKAVEEFGLLQSGQYLGIHFQDDWVDHLGVAISQTASPSENLKFDIGLGGVFAYQKDEKTSAEWPDATQWKMFLIGPSVADFRWLSAATGSQGFGLQLGMFDYKYNPDALDLGEYLFRSGPYPAFLITGSNVLMNDASVQLQGAKANYNLGNLTADLIVTTETTLPVFYDLSAALVLDYKLLGGALDLGAGANFKHLVPVRPHRVTPTYTGNAYFQKNGVWYSGYPDYYGERAKFYRRREQEDTVAAHVADYEAHFLADSTTADNVTTWMADPAAAGITPEYYTEKGLLLMARANLDLKHFFGSSIFGPQDMRLFAEAAVLGVKNYPVFYDDIMQRVPIMFGFNFPGFRIIDLISIQGEYFGSPYTNSYGSLFGNAFIPSLPTGDDLVASKTAYNDIGTHDNWAWSVLVQKKMAGAAWISARLARDHSRLASQKFWGGPGWVSDEIFSSPKDWYWMVQFGFAI